MDAQDVSENGEDGNENASGENFCVLDSVSKIYTAILSTGFNNIPSELAFSLLMLYLHHLIQQNGAEILTVKEKCGTDIVSIKRAACSVK